MAVKLRLKRMGSKKRPFYRIVAADSRCKRDGRFIELIGTYSPLEDNKVVIKEEVALKWLKDGALPTDTVRNILSREGIMEKFAKGKAKPTKKAVKKEVKPETKKAPVKKTTTKKTTTKTPAKKTTTKKATKEKK